MARKINKRISYELGTGGFMKPSEVLDKMDIEKGMKIADFGCGAGYFSIPLAQRAGKNSVVYAIDVKESALDSVRGRAKIYSVFNIETIRGNLEKEGGSTLGSGSLDMVLLANTLFQSKMKDSILNEAKRVLKKTGKIVVIEWDNSEPLGPQSDYRISKEDLKELAKNVSLVLEKEFTAGSSHYGLVFSL